MLVGRGMLAVLRAAGPLPDAVGGLAIGADPVAGAIVTMAGVEGLPLKVEPHRRPQNLNAAAAKSDRTTAARRGDA